MPVNSQPYLRPSTGEWSAEIEIKRSRFIGFVARTADEGEARSFIDAIASRYPDARHHCTAFIVHVDEAQPIERSSDDGEPAGTAGQPMLEVLRGSGLLDVTVVVVRYFGGVKLGTGGLVRAYQDATKEVLAQVTRVSHEPVDLFRVSVPHADAGRFEADIRAEDVQVVNVDYAAQAEFTLGVPAGDGPPLESVVAKISGGNVDIHEAGSTWVDRPSGQ
ncbi:YigZ family protein [Corynebacterium sp. ED61]|uniref:IMPACT family protein n=1 Tax=Corynebacterium sp. ED61 TaxID=2211360 RepID=UPI001883752C|nr:YigZ family protein [Corynebacterium sp. ED61]MBF0580679.1 YigZ family protein [Corynebacterium sp. ED61]